MLICNIGLRFSCLQEMTTLFKAHTLGLYSVRAGSLPPIAWSLRVFSFLSIVQNKPLSCGSFRGFASRFSSQLIRPLPAAKKQNR